MIKVLTLWLLHLYFNVSFSQNRLPLLSGFVCDSSSRHPLYLATITLKCDSANIEVSTTDKLGNFYFRNIAPCSYVITVTHSGYEQFRTTYSGNGDNISKHTLDSIFMSKSGELKEVVVTASKSPITFESDKISYNVLADPDRKVQSVFDMLTKVPMISTDAEDNIYIKGSQSFRILIDGKTTNVVTRNPKDYLRSMSATGIQKIEVITSPSSKYDAEGAAGIINIITYKNPNKGVVGNASLNYKGPVGGPSAGGNIGIKKGSFFIGANVGLGNFNSPYVSIINSREKPAQSQSNLLQDGQRKFNQTYLYSGLDMTYVIDSNNVVTLEATYNQGKFHALHNILSQESGGISEPYIRYHSRLDSDNPWSAYSLAFNYQHGNEYRRSGLFTFSYKNSFSSESWQNNINYNEKVNFSDPDFNQYNQEESDEQTLQIDYLRHLSKLTIEAGIKGIVRNNNALFRFDSLNIVQGEYLKDSLRSSDLFNKQSIFSAYNSYSWALSSFVIKMGARFEKTFVRTELRSGRLQLENTYNNLIPSASMSISLSNNNFLGLSFSQRLMRPSISQLNPFVDRSNPNIELRGNPSLKASLSNNIEVSYSIIKRISFRSTLTYSFSNNTIQRITQQRPEENVTILTYENIGRERTGIITSYASIPISKSFNISSDVGMNYISLKSQYLNRQLKNEGWLTTVMFRGSYKIDTWRWNASINYNSGAIFLQGSNKYNYSYSLACNKNFSDRLSIGIVGNNLFSKMFRYESYTDGVDFYQTTSANRFFRSYTLTANYNFGSIKERIRKTKRGILNDDILPNEKAEIL